MASQINRLRTIYDKNDFINKIIFKQMNDFDINILLNIIEKLSGKDTINFFNINSKLRRIHIKYDNIIWKNKLLKDYNSDNIGNAKSHYMGLELNKKHYYGFNPNNYSKISYSNILRPNIFFTNPGLVNFFTVFGIDGPVGEKVIWIHFFFSNIEFKYDIISKSLEEGRRKLFIDLKKEYNVDEKNNSKLFKFIENLEKNTRLYISENVNICDNIHIEGIFHIYTYEIIL